MSERHLSDKELHELIPTLPIEEIFLIEFKKDNKWSKFVDFDGRNLTCNICANKIFLPSLSSHCTSANHKENLTRIQKLFHPKRTPPKNPHEKLPEANIKQLFEKAKLKAQDFNREAQRIFDMTLNKKIRKMCLTTNVRDPKLVFVTFGLPLQQLMQLEYIDQGQWKPLITTERLSPNSKFFCCLCQVYCGGIITVGAHFRGHSHMNLQLSCPGLRHKIHKHLTKNCRIQCNKEYKMFIHPKARQIFKERAEKWLADIANLSGVQEELEALEDVAVCATDEQPTFENPTIVNANKPKVGPAVNGKALAITTSILERAEKAEATLEAKEEGLIGVEYVVKLMRPHNVEDLFECVLCETVYTESKMQVHLVSHDHRLKYCDIHYCDTMKKYKDMVGHMRYNDFFCCMSPLLSKLAVEIEKVHSRALPSAISEEEFMKQRDDYVGQIYAVKHACQAHGPSFSKVVSKADIEEFKKNRHNFKEPNIDSKPPCRFNQTPKTPYLGLFVYNLADRLDRSKRREPAAAKKSNSRERERERDRERDREHDSRSRHRSKSLSKSSTSRSSKRERERSVESPTSKMWKQYDKEVALEKKKIDRQYDDYRKQPEDHPLYEQEWNRFWKQRRDELIAEGIDHRTYNYQAEWVHYFKNRLEELFCEAVRQVKDRVRARLKMPIESEGASAPPNKMTRFSADPFGLQQMQQQQQLQQQFAQQQQFQRLAAIPTAAALPLQPAVQAAPVLAPAPVPQPVMLQQSSQSTARKSESKATDDRPNVIHVLRLMTAMEDHLGSLGAKIMDLFTKALQLEKKFSKNSAQLEKQLLTAEHCNLLEVAMEKLRGVVYAGLLEGNKANSFNKIIKATDELLNYAEMKGFRENVAESAPTDHASRNNNAALDIQNFLHAIQQKSSAPAAQQKSLSDTLKELMAGKGLKTEASPEPSAGRFSKEDHFRNSSPPPSYAYERSERNKSSSFMLNERENKTKRINESKFQMSHRDNDNDNDNEFSMDDRDLRTHFGGSFRDIKPSFVNEGRNFEVTFNAANRDIKPNMNVRESPPGRRQQLFDDRKYGRSNEFNIPTQHDMRGNMRQLSESPTKPSAGEMRLKNFNSNNAGGVGGSFLQNNMRNSGAGQSYSGAGYGGNVPNSNSAGDFQMGGRFEPKMSMQQFTRNISNYYQNRK